MDKVTPEALITFLWVGAALVAFALAVWALVLDRFDSTLMAVPAAVVYLYTLTLF